MTNRRGTGTWASISELNVTGWFPEQLSLEPCRLNYPQSRWRRPRVVCCAKLMQRSFKDANARRLISRRRISCSATDSRRNRGCCSMTTESPAVTSIVSETSSFEKSLNLVLVVLETPESSTSRASNKMPRAVFHAGISRGIHLDMAGQQQPLPHAACFAWAWLAPRRSPTRLRVGLEVGHPSQSPHGNE